MISPELQLTPRFKLKDLIVTEQKLSLPNLPSTDIELDNLYRLASYLEDLWTNIGPFRISSAYRTKELQQRLTASGDPTSLGTSFHELGRAVDIVPTSMGIAEFFGRLLANENMRFGYREIAIKPSQGSIHLAIKTPDDMRETKVMGLNENKVYSKLSLDEIAQYMAPYKINYEEAVQEAESLIKQTPPILAFAVAGGLFLIGLYFINRKTA